jgi:hypothetical protein
LNGRIKKSFFIIMIKEKEKKKNKLFDLGVKLNGLRLRLLWFCCIVVVVVAARDFGVETKTGGVMNKGVKLMMR